MSPPIIKLPRLSKHRFTSHAQLLHSLSILLLPLWSLALLLTFASISIQRVSSYYFHSFNNKIHFKQLSIWYCYPPCPAGNSEQFYKFFISRELWTIVSGDFSMSTLVNITYSETMRGCERGILHILAWVLVGRRVRLHKKVASGHFERLFVIPDPSCLRHTCSGLWSKR